MNPALIRVCCCALWLFTALRPCLAQADNFLIGADISWVPQQEAEGRHFSEAGINGDILALLRAHGFNAIRLRLFCNPATPGGYSAKGYCGLESTLAMAQRVKDAGFKLLLDLHYSDTWADPGHQSKPAAWRDLDFAALTNAVYGYTTNTLAEFRRRHLAPQIVQIGNEISAGMLWPDGKLKQWDKLAPLLAAGIRAARETLPETKIMLHLALGGQNAQSRAFLDEATRRGLDFDYIGQSYYPRWHGTLADLQANLTDVAQRYRQEIILVEHSTPDVEKLHAIVRGLPNHKGRGMFIWEPTDPKHGHLFDGKGNALPALKEYDALAKAHAESPDRSLERTVELWPEGKMPGRGARDGEAPYAPERTDAKRISNVSRPTLTLFPARGNRAAPTMIVCPGGGYSYVVVDKEGTEIASWLNSNGFGAVVLKYRVPNNREGAFQDVQRALSLTRAHAAEWNVDAKRLGVIGFSAGGHLAAKASTRFRERAYAAVDAADRESCRPDFAVLVYPAYLDDKNGHVSPELPLSAEVPPTLIVHSEDDKTFVPGSRLYDAALTAANVPHQFLLYHTGGHGYGLRSLKEAQAWPTAALEWLAQSLHPR